MLLIAFAVMMLVAKRPKLFWPMLIIAGIVGAGPRIKGYFFLDEIMAGSVVLGALLHISLRRSKHLVKTVTTSSHKVIFNLWIGFVIMESIVGVIYNADLRIIRWVLFYAMLGIIGSIIYHRYKEFPFPSFRHTSLIVVITTMVLYIVYIGQGMYFERLLGAHGRFLSQDMFWAGSAYAVFPTLIAVPASVFLLNDRSRNLRRLAYVSIIIMLIVAFYYDSRISLLVMGGYCFVFLPRIKVRKAIPLLLIFSLLFIAYMPEPMKNIPEFAKGMVESSQALWSPGKSDVNRNLQLRAGFLRCFDNAKTLLIGDGIYSHRFTVIPYIEELYRRYLPVQDFLIPGSRNDTKEITIFRTTGFTALLIDTGVIGMLLFAMNFIFVALKLFKLNSLYRPIFLVGIFMSYMWLFSNNITDVLLLYLLIMPRGLIEQWSRNSIVREPMPEVVPARRTL